MKENRFMKKSIFAIGIVLSIMLTTLCSCTSKVNSKTYFSNWSDNSAPKKEIIEFVENVTNKDSKDYIPVDDRIAVFDMDGTLFCETDPTYYEYMMAFDIILAEYKSSGAYADLIDDINEALKTGYVSDELELKLSDLEYKCYLDYDMDSYKEHINDFLNNETRSYSNLKIKDALYKPMVDVIKYLQDNDFTVYVVSGTERTFVRAVVCDGAGVKENNVIGMDFNWKAKNQGSIRNSEYQYTRNEEIVVSGPCYDVNVKTNKVLMISEEIGKVPVLAFGNSTGDVSMLEYTLSNQKYKSKGFLVLCDDTDRENGNLPKAENIKNICDERGFVSISMKNDWKTIYGDGVEKIFD